MILLLSTLLLFLLPLIWFLYISTITSKKRSSSPPQVYGFFHPYCSGGGGGERVLWKMIQILQQNNKDIIIYTIDKLDDKEENYETTLRNDAEQRFDVKIIKPIKLISLHKYKDYLKPSPYLSLLLESIGTMKLVYYAIQLYSTIDVYIDTTGCAFTFLIVKLVLPKCFIVAYVHYPTISTDMMQWERTKHTTTDTTLSRQLKIHLKLLYYKCFAILYGLVGSLADLVLVNSTWTYNHIHSLWWFNIFNKNNNQIQKIVYPPCRIIEEEEEEEEEDLDNESNKNKQKRERILVSIGQFRPEKNHKLQIDSIGWLLKQYSNEYNTSNDSNNNSIKLLLIGSCRNDDDKQRVIELQKLVTKLQLKKYVEFNINPPYIKLQESLQKSFIGLHTMRQEHFGIGIVEMMSSGLITIAHNSGGPKTDIIQPNKTGFLAITKEEYGEAIHTILSKMTDNEINTMRKEARISSKRFSDNEFDISFEESFKQSNLL